MDLFIAKGNVDQMGDMAMADPNNLLIRGADGRFTEAAQEAGIATTDRARGAAFADFDGDGRLDLVVVNRRAALELWRNLSDAGQAAFLDLQMPGTQSATPSAHGSSSARRARYAPLSAPSAGAMSRAICCHSISASTPANPPNCASSGPARPKPTAWIRPAGPWPIRPATP